MRLTQWSAEWILCPISVHGRFQTQDSNRPGCITVLVHRKDKSRQKEFFENGLFNHWKRRVIPPKLDAAQWRIFHRHWGRYGGLDGCTSFWTWWRWRIIWALVLGWVRVMLGVLHQCIGVDIGRRVMSRILWRKAGLHWCNLWHWIRRRWLRVGIEHTNSGLMVSVWQSLHALIDGIGLRDASWVDWSNLSVWTQIECGLLDRATMTGIHRSYHTLISGMGLCKGRWVGWTGRRSLSHGIHSIKVDCWLLDNGVTASIIWSYHALSLWTMC